MEESRGVYTLPVLYNEQSGRNEGVCVRKELGVVVAIDKIELKLQLRLKSWRILLLIIVERL